MASLMFNVYRNALSLRGRVPRFGEAYTSVLALEAGAKLPKAKRFRFRIRTPRRLEKPTHATSDRYVYRIGGRGARFTACYLPYARPELQHAEVVVETSTRAGQPWRRA